VTLTAHLRFSSLARIQRFLERRVLASAALLVSTFSATAVAQSFTTLVNFDITNGSNPIPALVQDVDGNFYGVTEDGGTNGGGTFFKMTSEGELTTLYDFCSGSGCGIYPDSALIRGIDGNFYGTTFLGSAPCDGSVFRMTPQGTQTTLYSFCSQANGQLPEASLVQGRDGNFYGTTYQGGSVLSGTAFRITPRGKLTTIHNFCSVGNCSDGGFPSAPGMILGSDGNLYGTTTQNDLGYGTVFSMTTSGQLTTLYTFCSQAQCTDGRGPGPLVQAADGNFYGTTALGGLGNLCQAPLACGTIFKITPSGEFTSIYSFCQKLSGIFCPDGYAPNSLIVGSDGNLYGTTHTGGVGQGIFSAAGTIFRITPDGTFTTLYTFCAQTGCPDGASPGNLVQSVDGRFFGATETETSAGYGTIFRADNGLPPFVQALPSFGKTRTSVLILGESLLSATSVSFNGMPATFKVLSKHQIKATVPEGASTGILTVVTNHGTVATNTVFSVIP
jgi:uncharacterized repeat protein (TIGR03803 family)